MGFDFTVLFTNGECVIKDEDSSALVVRIVMSKHRLFPFNVDDIGEAHLAVSKMADSLMRHRRYGHLHSQALQLLSRRKMVRGLPPISHVHDNEGCAKGK